MTTVERKLEATVETVTLTIDGMSCTVPKGTLIIRAAESLGVHIPRFCDHPLLEPIGACRQCLVEVEAGGRPFPKPQASCTIEVSDGMVVKTQLTSAVAEKAQEGQLEFLLINHPLDCPICDKGGECPLQNQSMSHGYSETRFDDVKRTYPKPIAISSQILLDRERCVLCARCTRFSAQIAGDPFIELFERGALEQVAIYEDEPFQSYFSGNTVQICPVGALTGASYRFRSRPFDLRSTPSICEHCASGCAQRTDWRRGKVTRRLAGNDPDVNAEWNCDKGRWAFVYAQDNARILNPMIRDDDGVLVETSWTTALEVAAAGLQEAVNDGGVGVLPGGRLTAEDAYAYAKFARVALGTNDIDARARAHSDEELEFLATEVAGTSPASGAVTYADLERASGVLLVGFEPEEESPIVYLRLRKAHRDNGLASFAIASWSSPGFTKIGATVIVTPPGAESSVLSAIAGGTAGGTAIGVAEALRENGIILVGERLAESPGAFGAVIALAQSTGARIAWIPRRAGERGAIDAGALPSLLPGGRLIADPVARALVGRQWHREVPAEIGRDCNGILNAAKTGELGALMIGGVDPDDLPDPQLARDALENVGFVVSLEMRPSGVTEWADVVLPVAPAAEKAGSFTNWEGRRRRFDLTLHATGALSDGRVLDALADEMGEDLRLPTEMAARNEIDLLGVTAERPVPEPVSQAAGVSPVAAGRAVLDSWRSLLDTGSLQEGEVHLAGTARAAVVRLSAATASEIRAIPGDQVTVKSPYGSITLPLEVAEMPERVVWLPMKSIGSELRRELRVPVGSVVDIVVYAEGGTKR